jgi:hypothetical protein
MTKSSRMVHNSPILPFSATYGEWIKRRLGLDPSRSRDPWTDFLTSSNLVGRSVRQLMHLYDLGDQLTSLQLPSGVKTWFTINMRGDYT